MCIRDSLRVEPHPGPVRSLRGTGPCPERDGCEPDQQDEDDARDNERSTTSRAAKDGQEGAGGRSHGQAPARGLCCYADAMKLRPVAATLHMYQ